MQPCITTLHINSQKPVKSREFSFKMFGIRTANAYPACRQATVFKH